MILETASRPDGMLHLHSAHDWSLVRLLMCLASRRQLKASSFPPFCSNLSIELWSEKADESDDFWAATGNASASQPGHFVRIVFNGQPLEMACGADLCSLGEFKKMLEKYLLDDYAAKCTLLPANETVTPSSNSETQL